MVIMQLMGGLGNQMFQYALGRSLSLRLKTDLKLDHESLIDRTPRGNIVFRDYDLDIFTLVAERATKAEIGRYLPRTEPKNTADKIYRKISNIISPHRYLYEPHFHVTPIVDQLPKDCYLVGYWQSPKYFKDVEAVIRNDFRFKEEMSPVAQELQKNIFSKNSVCINVRRLEYVNNSFHGLCDLKYFNPAIEIMKSKIDNPHFFIFSDDLEWCKENFPSNINKTFVGSEYFGPKFSDYLRLMSSCKHFIIPNSSYAWWGAWMNPDPDKMVITPKKWFADETWDAKDLIPENWMRVDN